MSGESGGGNLCLATALKARQEGWIDQIAGVYACCPYLAGPEAYDSPPPELPPHTISVNDPLRDEGLVYARKLMAAGVPTISRTVNGTVHGADTEVMVGAMPDVYGATIRDIHGFAA